MPASNFLLLPTSLDLKSSFNGLFYAFGLFGSARGRGAAVPCSRAAPRRTSLRAPSCLRSRSSAPPRRRFSASWASRRLSSSPVRSVAARFALRRRAAASCPCRLRAHDPAPAPPHPHRASFAAPLALYRALRDRRASRHGLGVRHGQERRRHRVHGYLPPGPRDAEHHPRHSCRCPRYLRPHRRGHHLNHDHEARGRQVSTRPSRGTLTSPPVSLAASRTSPPDSPSASPAMPAFAPWASSRRSSSCQ